MRAYTCSQVGQPRADPAQTARPLRQCSIILAL